MDEVEEILLERDKGCLRLLFESFLIFEGGRDESLTLLLRLILFFGVDLQLELNRSLSLDDLGQLQSIPLLPMVMDTEGL